MRLWFNRSRICQVCLENKAIGKCGSCNKHICEGCSTDADFLPEDIWRELYYRKVDVDLLCGYDQNVYRQARIGRIAIEGGLERAFDSMKDLSPIMARRINSRHHEMPTVIPPITEEELSGKNEPE